jgi:nucleoside-diphosphate-sugar epimerase
VILVTGRSGFIGRAVCQHLLLNNIRYCTITRQQLRDPEILPSITSIIHCAADPNPKPDYENPDEVFESNLLVTNRLLAAYREQIAHFTLLSSLKVYGSSDTFLSEEFVCQPDCLYGVSKLAAEELVKSYAKTFKFDYSILRLCPVVGARQKRGIVYDFLRKARSDSPNLDIIGSEPGSFRPYIHVNDVVRAISLSQQLSGIFNVSSDSSISNMLVAEAILDKLKIKKNIVFTGDSWIGDSQKMLSDSSKLLEYGWDRMFDSPEEAVSHAVHF